VTLAVFVIQRSNNIGTEFAAKFSQLNASLRASSPITVFGGSNRSTPGKDRFAKTFTSVDEHNDGSRNQNHHLETTFIVTSNLVPSHPRIRMVNETTWPSSEQSHNNDYRQATEGSFRR
jgi:hypothetical protein